MPRIRALAFQRWQEAMDAVATMPADGKRRRAENTAFWVWALLELLVQSGLRIEEAHELTTLDIVSASSLSRNLVDGHRSSERFRKSIKPSLIGYSIVRSGRCRLACMPRGRGRLRQW
jgi:hypothetical protein